MRVGFAMLVVALAAGCAGGGVAGKSVRPASPAGREAASRSLCSCIQGAANETLAAADQRRAATFFADPQRAHDTRFSDRPADDAFWDRYDAFVDRARSRCG